MKSCCVRWEQFPVHPRLVHWHMISFTRNYRFKFVWFIWILNITLLWSHTKMSVLSVAKIWRTNFEVNSPIRFKLLNIPSRFLNLFLLFHLTLCQRSIGYAIEGTMSTCITEGTMSTFSKVKKSRMISGIFDQMLYLYPWHATQRTHGQLVVTEKCLVWLLNRNLSLFY